MKYGAVAQLGERLPCTEEVAGSNPVSSTCAGARMVKGVDCKPTICRFDSDPPLKKYLYLRNFVDIYYCGGSVIGNTLSFQGRDVGSTPALRSTFGQRGYLTIEN